MMTPQDEINAAIVFPAPDPVRIREVTTGLVETIPTATTPGTMVCLEGKQSHTAEVPSGKTQRDIPLP